MKIVRLPIAEVMHPANIESSMPYLGLEKRTHLHEYRSGLPMHFGVFNASLQEEVKY